jgi:hypothetical protein
MNLILPGFFSVHGSEKEVNDRTSRGITKSGIIDFYFF